jgi:tRNA (cmo5U34)-methyltransferase
MKKNDKRDTVFAQPQEMIVDFAFDEKVAGVFPDMIRRSVPGYDAVIPLLGVFSQRFVQANTAIYDLGCSLGAATLALRRRISQPGCRIIAVDNAPAMIEQCQQHVAADSAATPVEVVCMDILDVEIQAASLVVMNFTLQFIPPAQRLPLLEKIHAGLCPGGALVLTDKIIFADVAEQHAMDSLHAEFKRANGYSDLEISQKRSALENVLIADTLSGHHQRLQQTGFSQVYTWFQCFNFAGVCAIK